MNGLKNNNKILEDNSINRFYTDFCASNSINNFITEYRKSDSFDVSMGGQFIDVGANFAAKILANNSETYKNYTSKFYYCHYSYLEISSKALPNYATDLSDYINNLDRNYVISLNRLNKGMLKYSDFFNMYGTHLIAKAIYGGKLDVFYSVLTNFVSIDNNKVNELQNSLNASLLGNPGSNVSFNLASISGFKDSDNNLAAREIFRAVGKGGYGLSVTNIYGFGNAYSDWYSSIRLSPSIIGYGKDGLIPLWELLPKHLSHLKPIMEEEFQKYATEYYYSIISNFATPNIYRTEFTSIRKEEYTITDSGRYNQPFDKVSFEKWGLNIEHMKNHYRTVSITIKIDVRQINDGYQGICLYSDSNKRDISCMSEQEFEIGSSIYTTRYFYFDNIPLEPFYDLDNAFYLRFGARGFGADTWQNKDLKISLEFKK